ncbi:MAG TPA: serine protease [Kofleriaceae bacterium]|nr:serine protease [Kofleriaceae bacterium]
MDKYFVVEPGAEPHGPYPLPEIANLLAAGTVTPRAILRKAGDASAPPRPTVIDVAPIEAPKPAAAKVMDAAKESAKRSERVERVQRAERQGPPPGVSIPPGTASFAPPGAAAFAPQGAAAFAPQGAASFAPGAAPVAPPVAPPMAPMAAPTATPPVATPVVGAPNVTPVVVAPSAAPTGAPSVTPVVRAPIAEPSPLQGTDDISVQVDMTNPVEQFDDDGWGGETEIHGDQSSASQPVSDGRTSEHAWPAAGHDASAPTFVPPQASQPHHRAARGTEPQAAWPTDPTQTQPSMSLAVIADRPRRQPEPAAQPALPAPAYELASQAPAAPQLAKPAEDSSPLRFLKQKKLTVGVGIAAVAIGGVAVALIARSGHDTSVKDALVRVSTPSGTGTGFLIDGPDQYIYVATANHLVDRGERVLVERDVNISDKKHYVEAYPETEIVATDPDADLAIIRVKNVAATRFSRLPLAKEPIKDAKIFSYGYPGSSLVKHAGLVSKDGKILSLVRFPAYDERYARVLRENAVDGLLVSTDIEPGFSGGPTTNEAGEVVGINVTKDRAHVGQNGAVSVVALRDLLAKVKPASKQVEPKAEDIVTLLKKVQSEYLLLPLEERSRVRETDFLAASDLPALRQFVNEIRREERNTDNAFIVKLRLSGQAALGMYFARLPGNLLETYRAPSTKTAITSCALANQRLASFFGELDTNVGKRRNQPLVDTCDELGVRPLAWDLAAATLQWDGKEKDYTVTKIDRMDDEGNVYRASVRISGAANLVELWFGIEQGQPRLKLFDTTENLYAIDSPRTISTSVLQGTWAMKRPRVTDAVDKDAEVESEDKLSVSIGEEHRVSILYTTTQRYFAVSKRSSFPCSGKKSMEVGYTESFVGTLENGVVIATPEKAATPSGADADYCTNRRLPDQIIAVKLVGDQLFLYRTDGSAYPETIQLAKQL